MVISKPVYSPHPSIAHWNSMLASLPGRSGKTMDEWLAALRQSGTKTTAESRKWLKEKHGLGLSTIGIIMDKAEGKGPLDTSDPEALVDGIFSGPKAQLRPVYEEILHHGSSLGEDVKVCPCATIVPFYRHHVFAQIKVPNRATIHLGLALGDLPAEGPLVSTGGFEKKDRITHRIELTADSHLSKDQKHWFHLAYKRDNVERK